MDATSKVVLITGANGGLGTSVTNAFLEAGWRAIGAARSISDSDFPQDGFSAIAAEISSRESAGQLVNAAIRRAGRIDALVHLVGGFAGGQSVAQTDDATFDRMFNLNLRSTFHMLGAVLPKMREQGWGRIIAIGSKAAVEPSPMSGAYAASKAALVSLVRTVARENADRGITANAVLPGTIDTPANRAGDPAADHTRWIQPGHIASLLVYLASGEAAQLNGAVIPVYGAEA